MMILAYGMGGKCILRKSEWGCPESRQAHSSSRDERQATAPRTPAMVKITCRLGGAQLMTASYNSSKEVSVTIRQITPPHPSPLVRWQRDRATVWSVEDQQQQPLLICPKLTHEGTLITEASGAEVQEAMQQCSSSIRSFRTSQLPSSSAAPAQICRRAHPEIPLVRAGVGDNIVIADGDEGAIVEERDEHQHEYWQLEERRPLRSNTHHACFTGLCSRQCSLPLHGVSSKALHQIGRMLKRANYAHDKPYCMPAQYTRVIDISTAASGRLSKWSRITLGL